MLKSLMIFTMLTSCSHLNRSLDLEDDNEFEEFTEVIIETKTGVRIDLTPKSPE